MCNDDQFCVILNENLIHMARAFHFLNLNRGGTYFLLFSMRHFEVGKAGRVLPFLCLFKFIQEKIRPNSTFAFLC